MSEQCKTAGIDAAVSDSPIVRRVMVFSGLLLLLLTAGGWRTPIGVGNTVGSLTAC